MKTTIITIIITVAYCLCGKCRGDVIMKQQSPNDTLYIMMDTCFKPTYDRYGKLNGYRYYTKKRKEAYERKRKKLKEVKKIIGPLHMYGIGKPYRLIYVRGQSVLINKEKFKSFKISDKSVFVNYKFEKGYGTTGHGINSFVCYLIIKISDNKYIIREIYLSEDAQL